MDGHAGGGREERDDRELVEAFQGGDAGSFDALVLRHQDRVVNLCFRILGEYEEACDSAQDAFVKAYRSLKRFEGRSSFATWLYRIAVNTCKNRVSSSAYRRRSRTLSLDAREGGRSNPRRAEPVNGSPTPDVEVEKREAERAVRIAVDSLDGDQRTVVVLRDIEGLPYEEVARVTGLPIGTVKSRLARARDKLREKLRGKI